MIKKESSNSLLKDSGKLLVLALLLSFSLMACSKSDDPIPSYPKDVVIEYKITSTTGINKVTSLSYSNMTGGNTSLSDASIPFSKKIERKVNLGDDVGLSILHNNSALGNMFNLKLEIYVDNILVKTETFEGTTSAIGAIVHLFL